MHDFYVLTGAPGSGKSAIVDRLRSFGFAGLGEPARQILAEQRSFGGRGVPEKDAGLFTQLMLSRSIFEHRRMRQKKFPSFFDRGVPDVVAYADLYELNTAPARAASQAYRYNRLVFFVPSWADIYCQDDERKMTYDEACRFGRSMRRVYQDLGYDLVEVPRDTPEGRADFILTEIMSARDLPRTAAV